MPEIITIGETMACFTPKSAGPLRYVKDYEMRIAGAESNVAIGVSKLGHSAGWISALGTDELGHFVLNSVRAEGVDTASVRFDKKRPTGLMLKQINSGSDSSVFYYRQDSAACHMDAALLDKHYFEGAKILHLTGITPVLSRECKAMVQSAIELARSLDMMVSFDPNIRMKLWGNRDYRPMIREFINQSDIIFIGKSEAEILFQSEEEEQIFQQIFSSGVAKMIALKNGAKGAFVAEKGRVKKVAPYPCNCVDPIGAGDAFCAAFLCGLLEKRTAEECGERGAIAGALVTETYGDIEGYPSREDLLNVQKNRRVVYR